MTRDMRDPVEPIDRNELTKQLLTYMGPLLKAKGILIGRGVAPQDGGWSGGGQPGEGTFTPYVVLKTGQAVTAASGERPSLGRSRLSWNLTYTLATHHRLDSLVDELAKIPRRVVLGFSRGVELVLGDTAWTVQEITVPRLGATARDNSTDPAHWQVNDDVSLHVSRAQRG